MEIGLMYSLVVFAGLIVSLIYATDINGRNLNPKVFWPMWSMFIIWPVWLAIKVSKGIYIGLTDAMKS